MADNLFLDYASPAAPGYAVFGKVVSDMAVVDTIATKPTGVAGGMPDVPLASPLELGGTMRAEISWPPQVPWT